MRAVALLPMKANSERVVGKNFRDFRGKPLFRWMLDSLLSVDAVDQVVINTDARTILGKHGIENSERVLIRDRRPEICGDAVSMNKIILDDLENVAADVYLMTHTTNPLLSPETIRNALDRYFEALAEGADSLFSVNRVQTRFYRKDGSSINHDPRHLVPTQQLEPWFEENSCLYIFSRQSFHASGARIGAHPRLFESPRLESIDIDTVDDWDMAIAIASYLYPRDGGIT